MWYETSIGIELGESGTVVPADLRQVMRRVGGPRHIHAEKRPLTFANSWNKVNAN